MEIVWREDVVHPRHEEAASEGFGTTLLHNAVVRQLGGAMSREWSDKVLSIRMLFPPETLNR
jgi:two-component sensor histidine kinase